ncbi:N-(5'-phosphoribosyl)anthranilate isomerase [Tabrizicola sp.]|uniref:N-(5'-phosphoribosyl)anthranilate isomerase n=1 Tax=Tabrizicola sp. TaxID=2005166 RepID=UPI002FDD7768
MLPMTDHMSPERWVTQMFSARTAAEGGIVRRRVADVERLVGRDRFIREIARRGFRAVENGGHFIVFCNAEPVKIVV